MQIHDDTRLFNMIMAVENGDCDVNYTKVDCIMLDESQDMNKDHYRMLCLVLQQNAYQFIILGDPRQQVYDFQGADTKYLLYCQEYFHHLLVLANQEYSYEQDISIHNMGYHNLSIDELDLKPQVGCSPHRFLQN